MLFFYNGEEETLLPLYNVHIEKHPSFRSQVPTFDATEARFPPSEFFIKCSVQWNLGTVPRAFQGPTDMPEKKVLLGLNPKQVEQKNQNI